VPVSRETSRSGQPGAIGYHRLSNGWRSDETNGAGTTRFDRATSDSGSAFRLAPLAHLPHGYNRSSSEERTDETHRPEPFDPLRSLTYRRAYTGHRVRRARRDEHHRPEPFDPLRAADAVCSTRSARVSTPPHAQRPACSGETTGRPRSVSRETDATEREQMPVRPELVRRAGPRRRSLPGHPSHGTCEAASPLRRSRSQRRHL